MKRAFSKFYYGGEKELPKCYRLYKSAYSRFCEWTAGFYLHGISCPNEEVDFENLFVASGNC